MQVTAVNMSVVYDKAANLEVIMDVVETALRRNTDLVVFPEMCLQGYLRDDNGTQSPADFEYHHANAEAVPGPSTLPILQRIAGSSTWVVLGLTERSPHLSGAVLFNTSVLLGPTGLGSVYRKVHLPGDELHYFSHGIEWKVASAAGTSVGMCICYDLQFPESTRALALQGATLIAFPTAWPAHASDQFELLTRTRAMENQVYLVAANQVDPSGEPRGFYGHSRVVAPDGTVLADAEDSESVTVDIDVKAGVLGARTGESGTLNLLRDRQPETYGIVSETSLHRPPPG